MHREWDFKLSSALASNSTGPDYSNNSVAYQKKPPISHAFLRLCPFGTSSINIQNTPNSFANSFPTPAQSNTVKNWRYLITFPSQGVADEWWRAIQDFVAKKIPNWDHIKRITPQLYNTTPLSNELVQLLPTPLVFHSFLTGYFSPILRSQVRFPLAPSFLYRESRTMWVGKSK